MNAEGLITLEAAWASVARHVTPLLPERVALAEASGRVLAENLRADRDIPAADRSSMDGFAFRHDPAAPAPLRLRVAGEVQAGMAPPVGLRPGECVRIFTGALLPAGADTVVMQEDVAASGGEITVQVPPAPGAYVLRQGSDARAGDVLAAAGVVLSPLHVALAATVGMTKIPVVAKPRVAVLTTGEELCEPGEPVALHQIRDSNRDLVRAQLRVAGFGVAAAARAGDREADMAAAAERLLESADVLIVIGGMSVGNYDFAPAALRRLGATIHFHRVQARPGKPQLFATQGAKLVFGLPGNPLSVMVGLHELVLPALRVMSGRTPAASHQPRRARLAGPVAGLPGLVNFRPAILRQTATGPEAEVLATPRSSADLITASAADGFVIVPPAARLEAGAWVDFRSWREES